MTGLIAAWFADKTFQLAVAMLALLAIIAVPAAIIQTVRLDGISLFGWHLADGALAARDKALNDLGACRANGATLQGALDLQNAKIAQLGKQSAAAQERAIRALAAVRGQGEAASARERKILAAHSGADACKSADALILESVQ